MSNWHGSTYKSFDWGSCLTAIVFVVAVILSMTAIQQIPNAISEQDAISRFYEISGAKTITVIRHSNNDWLFGNTHNVSFELNVDGRKFTGVCSAGIYSEMICMLVKSPAPEAPLIRPEGN